MLLAEADQIYFGNLAADKVYLGTQLIWPVETGWLPTELSGLVTWLDAKDYTSGAWPNKGSGPAVTVPGTPAPTISVNQLNGMPLVRFKTNEGRVRSTFPYNVYEWTLVYLVRWVGPGVGRAFSVQYPPSNLLVGLHTSQPDWMYDNGGSLTPGTGWNWWNPGPGPWRMYAADQENQSSSAFYIDGAQVGSRIAGSVPGGLTNGWGISGYATTEETIDIEVAELVLYNRRLSDVERQQVEGYLQQKWFGVTYDPDTQAYLTATGLDTSYAPILDNLVLGLKQYGLWSKMSAIYPMIGGTPELHKWNLKDPRDTDNAYRLRWAQNQGGVYGVHSESLGYRPNPQGQVVWGACAGTYLIPNAVLNQDSTHLSYYSLLDVPAISRCEMGCYNWAGTGSRFHIIARYQPSEYYYGMSEDGFSNGSVSASSGLFISTRTGSTAQAGYRNGNLVGSNTAPSIALPNVEVFLGAINQFQDRSDLPCGFASIGSGLTAQNATDLYTVVQEYQTALGRQRSPIE